MRMKYHASSEDVSSCQERIIITNENKCMHAFAILKERNWVDRVHKGKNAKTRGEGHSVNSKHIARELIRLEK